MSVILKILFWWHCLKPGDHNLNFPWNIQVSLDWNLSKKMLKNERTRQYVETQMFISLKYQYELMWQQYTLHIHSI